MLDEDDRELRLMKEMYLEDGDLHNDGAGRTRRFRWANIGKNGGQWQPYTIIVLCGVYMVVFYLFKL